MGYRPLGQIERWTVAVEPGTYRERVWVTLDKPDARARLDGETVIWAHGPTNRRPDRMVSNVLLATRVLRRHRPDWVLSNGAGVAPPFFLAARAARIPTVFMEVVDRVHSSSLSARLCAPLATRVVVQSEEQAAHHPGAIVLGPLW